MHKPECTEEPIGHMLRETKVSGGQGREFCRQHGMAEQTSSLWRRTAGGLELTEAVRL